MTTFNEFTDRNRDQQDGFERNVFGKLEYVKGAGAIVKVRGTDTQDEEMPVLNIGYSANYPKDFNTEVFGVSHGSDTDQKYAIMTIPRDKQREWKENTSGIQNAQDPKKAIEFNKKRTWGTEDNWAQGASGALELKDGKLYFRVPVVADKTITVNDKVITPAVISGKEAVPGWSE